MTSAQQDFDLLNRTAGLAQAQAWQAYMDAQKNRQLAQLEWDKLDQTAIQTDIDNAQSDVTSRKTDLDNAQTDFNKYSGLAIDNATRKSYRNRAAHRPDQLRPGHPEIGRPDQQPGPGPGRP